jgi:hypothetical protein
LRFSLLTFASKPTKIASWLKALNSDYIGLNQNTVYIIRFHWPSNFTLTRSSIPKCVFDSNLIFNLFYVLYLQLTFFEFLHQTRCNSNSSRQQCWFVPLFLGVFLGKIFKFITKKFQQQFLPLLNEINYNLINHNNIHCVFYLQGNVPVPDFGRVACPKCGKILAKNYLRRHVSNAVCQKNRWKQIA